MCLKFSHITKYFSGTLFDNHFYSIQVMKICRHNSLLAFGFTYYWCGKLTWKPPHGFILWTMYLGLLFLVSFLVFIDKLSCIYAFRFGLFKYFDYMDIAKLFCKPYWFITHTPSPKKGYKHKTFSFDVS